MIYYMYIDVHKPFSVLIERKLIRKNSRANISFILAFTVFTHSYAVYEILNQRLFSTEKRRTVNS